MPEIEKLAVPISRSAGKRCAAQHFGAWAIEPKFFKSAIDAIRAGVIKPVAAGKEPNADIFDDDDDDGDSGPGYTIRDGIAIICMDGQMTKKGSSFGGCSTIACRQAVRDAADDWMVHAILLHICSPGGTVAGTADLAGDVQAVQDGSYNGKETPVYAFIADMGCSAAYWVASQTKFIWANVTAFVGSIGTYALLEDDTGYQEQWGMKYRVVSTGEYKGLGADGAVTDKLVADVQREVDELNVPFLAAVAAGRGEKIADLPAIADGRAHVGEQAKQLGLIDEVSTLDAALAAISQEISNMPITAEQFSAHAAANPQAAEVLALVQQGHDKGYAKAVADLKPKAATVSELEAAFAGQDKFILDQLKAGATMEQANAAAVKSLAESLKTKETALAEATGKLAKAADGTPPIPADRSTDANGQMSDARRKELLGQTTLGQAILQSEKK